MPLTRDGSGSALAPRSGETERQPSGGDKNPLGVLPARIAISGRYLLINQDQSTSHIDAETRDAMLLAGTIRQLSPGRFLDISKPIKVRISAAEDSRWAILTSSAIARYVRRYLNGRWIWVLGDVKVIDTQMTQEGLALEEMEGGHVGAHCEWNAVYAQAEAERRLVARGAAA